MIRIRAGISYALTEAMSEGHCGLPTDQLIPLGVELLDVPMELVQTALDLELSEGTVIADTVGEMACIFLSGLYRAEQEYNGDIGYIDDVDPDAGELAPVLTAAPLHLDLASWTRWCRPMPPQFTRARAPNILLWSFPR